MRKRVNAWIAVIGFLAIVLGSINAWATEEAGPSASADIAVLSKYVWRGFELSKNSIVIQPSTTLSYKGFSFNLWGNLDTDVYGSDPSEGQFNETDMTLSYDKSFGIVNVGLGYIYYGLDGVDDSQELYLSLGLDTLLSPSLTIYREIAHLPSWYVSFGISHSIELPKDISLDISGTVGYYYSDDEDFVEIDSNLNPTTDKYKSLHDGLISVGLTIPFAKYFTAVPMIAYSFPLTTESDDLIAYTNAFSNDSEYFFGGITLNMSF